MKEMVYSAKRLNPPEMVEDELFSNKFEIPVYFINLILSKYGMKLRGWENDIPRVEE